MAQTTGRDSARSETGKAAEMAHDMVEQTTGAVAEGIAATAEAVQSGTERMLDTAKELAAGAALPWSGWCSTAPRRQCKTWSRPRATSRASGSK